FDMYTVGKFADAIRDNSNIRTVNFDAERLDGYSADRINDAIRNKSKSLTKNEKESTIALNEEQQLFFALKKLRDLGIPFINPTLLYALYPNNFYPTYNYNWTPYTYPNNNIYSNRNGYGPQYYYPYGGNYYYGGSNFFML
ncbi:unnamed protein product, partial [Adineta steineri]